MAFADQVDNAPAGSVNGFSVLLPTMLSLARTLKPSEDLAGASMQVFKDSVSRIKKHLTDSDAKCLSDAIAEATQHLTTMSRASYPRDYIVLLKKLADSVAASANMMARNNEMKPRESLLQQLMKMLGKHGKMRKDRGLNSSEENAKSEKGMQEAMSDESEAKKILEQMLNDGSISAKEKKEMEKWVEELTMALIIGKGVGEDQPLPLGSGKGCSKTGSGSDRPIVKMVLDFYRNADKKNTIVIAENDNSNKGNESNNPFSSASNLNCHKLMLGRSIQGVKPRKMTSHTIKSLAKTPLYNKAGKRVIAPGINLNQNRHLAIHGQQATTKRTYLSELCVVIDTSGSVSDEEIARVFAMLAKSFEKVRPTKLHIVLFNLKPYYVTTIDSLDTDIKALAKVSSRCQSGGTNIANGVSEAVRMFTKRIFSPGVTLLISDFEDDEALFVSSLQSLKRITKTKLFLANFGSENFNFKHTAFADVAVAGKGFQEMIRKLSAALKTYYSREMLTSSQNIKKLGGLSL